MSPTLYAAATMKLIDFDFDHVRSPSEAMLPLYIVKGVDECLENEARALIGVSQQT